MWGKVLLTLIGPLSVAPVQIDSIGSFVVASACLRLIRATLDHLCLIKEAVVSRIRATTMVSSRSLAEKAYTSLASILSRRIVLLLLIL